MPFASRPKPVLLLWFLTALARADAAGPQDAAPANNAADAELRKLLDAAWEQDLRDDPLLATRAGRRDGADQLPRVGLDSQRQQTSQRRGRLEQLHKIDREQLSIAGRTDYAILERQLQHAVTEHELSTHLIPITNREGFHISFPELPNLAPLRDVSDYENYIARLRAFARYTDEHIELMRRGMETGMVLPAVVLQGFGETIEPHLVKRPAQSLLYAAFQKFPERVPSAERERLTAAGAAAIEQQVIPSYRKFLRFIEDEYLPAARGSIGAAALPQGRELYRHRVRHFTTLDITPEEVHRIGLEEVRRIRGEMETVRRRAKFDGDHKAFIEFLRTDPQFYAATPEQLLKEVAFTLKEMDGRLPQLFGKLPRIPYGIKQVPAYVAPRTTSAYYMQPSGDGRRAGFYFVNTYDLKSRPLFEVEALSFHEAVPGHHLQLALQVELEGVHELRRYAEVTAFVEGWALYSERLGLEAGFYQDPYSDFGRLSFEMWRACRLVVDTGLHYLGWSRQQALDYMAEHTALSLHNVRAEVDRYIAWPGQALAYKMGELKIRELRKEAERELGSQFDLRSFHDALLESGAVPLPLLEEQVRRFISRAKRPMP